MCCVGKTRPSCKITAQGQRQMSFLLLSFYHLCFIAYHVRLWHCSFIRSLSMLLGVTCRVLLTWTTGLALKHRKYVWDSQKKNKTPHRRINNIKSNQEIVIIKDINCLHLHVLRFTIPINKDRIRQRSHSQIRVQIIVHVQIPRQRISKQRHRSRSWREHLKNSEHSTLSFWTGVSPRLLIVHPYLCCVFVDAS